MRLRLLLCICIVILLNGCSSPNQSTTTNASLGKAGAEDAAVEQNLKTFDTLDFDVYSNQKWDRLSESHADDIVVTYPDGHQTKGLAAHIAELKPLFVFAPDTKITEHPVRLGKGDMTAVTGVMSGTFSRPMPIGNGKTIPPTNKKFTLGMATVAHWKDGKMTSENLYWDNQSLLKQIGVAQ